MYTEEIKAIVGEVPLNHPEIVKFLTVYLDEKLILYKIDAYT